jgi:hypothetical protein
MAAHSTGMSPRLPERPNVAFFRVCRGAKSRRIRHDIMMGKVAIAAWRIAGKSRIKQLLNCPCAWTILKESPVAAGLALVTSPCVRVGGGLPGTTVASHGSVYRPFRERCRRRIMKLTRPGHHPHHVGYEGSHVMLPMVGLSLMAIGLYYGVRGLDISELGRDALFDVVMVFVALGIAGLFGVVGAWLRSRGDEAEEGFCFVGALIGAVVFYVALFS